MELPVLATKLFMPSARPDTIHRSRLLKRLDEITQHRLTLVNAPAGFGKTTLLADWISTVELSIAWISLDRADNDPIRFLTYLTHALQDISQPPGKTTPSHLNSTLPEAVLTPLLNSLAGSTEHTVLILDDYHLISNDAVHRITGFMLENAPPAFHLVLSTRAAPPFPLARMRSRQELLKINSRELSFTPQEASDFLASKLHKELPEEYTRVLSERTEGWIAGLHMAALSLMHREDTDTFIREFSGVHDYVADYLTDEVISRQTATIQSFLLETSILGQLNASLCEAVTGQENAGAILEKLNRSSLFTISLDDRREWYRYHHLFAELLRARLYGHEPDLPSHLHHRASLWYEQHAMPADAIHHALAGEDNQRAAGLIEHSAEELLRRSELLTLEELLDQLPDHEIQTRPVLKLYHAGVKLMAGTPMADISSSLVTFPAQMDDFPSGEFSVLKSLIAALRGQVQLSRSFAPHALDNLPDGSPLMRSLADQNLGFACISEGEFDKALDALNEAAETAVRKNIPLISVISLSHTAEILIEQGLLAPARSTYDRALNCSHEGEKALPIAGMPLIGLAEIHREMNQLDIALPLALEGTREAARWSPVSAIDGHITLAHIHEALGDTDRADHALSAAVEQARLFDATFADDMIVACHQAAVWYRRGDIQQARYCFEHLHTSPDLLKEARIPYTVQLLLTRTQARLDLAGEHVDLALSRLAEHQASAEGKGAIRSIIEGSILQSLVYNRLNNIRKSHEFLGHALELAEPGGFIRIFADEGPALARILYDYSSTHPGSRYASRLLDSFHPRVKPGTSPSHMLIEPLSPRELEILQLISQGLSNKEIASSLVISIRTVKWHTSNIYSKLNVSNRSRAAAYARELGIIH